MGCHFKNGNVQIQKAEQSYFNYRIECNCPLPISSSLMPQRRYWIHLGGAGCGDVAGYQRNQAEDTNG